MDGKEVEMQVDTGDAGELQGRVTHFAVMAVTCSVMARAVHEEMFGELKSARDHVKPCLSAFGGTPLTVPGKVEVRVQHQGQKRILPLVVVEGNQGCSTLIGRGWDLGLFHPP